jgi:predicted DNA-binding transcriptional regulator AlpA
MSTALEELMHAALVAAPDRRDDALAVLRGQLAAIDPAKTPPTHEPYLTLREIGQRLGISSATLWRWQVPGHSLGGRRRFRLSEVEAYLKTEAFERRAAALRADRKHRSGEAGPRAKRQ